MIKNVSWCPLLDPRVLPQSDCFSNYTYFLLAFVHFIEDKSSVLVKHRLGEFHAYPKETESVVIYNWWIHMFSQVEE